MILHNELLGFVIFVALGSICGFAMSDSFINRNYLSACQSLMFSCAIGLAYDNTAMIVIAGYVFAIGCSILIIVRSSVSTKQINNLMAISLLSASLINALLKVTA